MNSGPIHVSYGVSGTQSGNTYFIDMYCDGVVVTGCSSDIGSSFTGTLSSIPVTFWTGGVGTGRVRIKVYKSGGTPSDSGWYNVTVTSPYQPATLALAQYGWSRDVGRCVANCFENVQSYSTPAYTSVDVARSLTLVYRSWQAHPLGAVQIDATDYSQTPADSLSLLLQRSNGTYVTFTSGLQEIFFRGGVANGTTRLAAQFDASANGTSDSTYTAIVKSYWQNHTVQQASLAVRVMVINESTSPYGAGWSIAGLQRVYAATDGGVVVADGSGSASFFSGSCSPSSSCTFTSPNGDFSTLSTGNNAYKRHYPDGTDYTFTSAGLLSSVVDRFGNSTSYFFDLSNRIFAIDDFVGTGVSFYYDAGTQKLSRIEPPGSPVRPSAFSIDANGDLRSVTDPDNVNAFQADYAAGTHRLTHTVDRRGGAWDFAYAADGTLDTAHAPTITASGSQTRPTATLSGPSARIFAAIASGAGTASNPVARGIDLRATVTNPRGYSTNYTVNQWGSPTLVQDALGRNETFGYDANSGQLTSHTAVSGRQTSYIWYGPQLVQVTDGPSTVHIEYGETMFNQPTHIYGDVTEQWMTYITNQTGRPLLTRRVAGQGPTTYSFDGNGRILTVSDTLGHVTTWYHQPICCSGLANTDSISPPGLLATWYIRDGYGRVIATRHANGTRDSTYYDLLNRDTTDVDGSLHRTHYTFDALFTSTITDPKSQQYFFMRNALGWVEQETRPGSATPLRTAYDADGNVISTTDRQGRVVTHVFDALDRDTLITADALTTHITYGANDQFLRFINSESTDSLVADSYGRYTQFNSYRPGSGSTYSIVYSLGNDDLLLGMTATSNRWSGTRGPSFTYDSTKNVKTLTSFAGTATITWNRDGLPTQVQFPNGATASSDFTSAHEVASLLFNTASLGSRILRDSLGRIAVRAPQDFDQASFYGYNPDGSLASWGLAPQDGFCSFNPSYGYWCSSGIPVPQVTYTYDQVGNAQNGGATYTANRLITANGFTMTYDEDGNLKTKNGPGFSQSLSWNSLGQLTDVTTNGTLVTFGYDGLGRRVRKSVSGGSTTGYLYSGDDLYMELDSGGSPVTEYAYWPSIDSPLAISRGGQTYYLTQDPAGRNITGVVRASDNSIQASYDYAPFGTLRSGSFDNLGNSLQFAARPYDSETGLSFFRARYYDPQIGRFISEDPIGLAGGINPYVFAANDPINGADPSGLDGNDGCPDGWHRETVTYGGTLVSDECFQNPVTGGENQNPSNRGSDNPPPGPSSPGTNPKNSPKNTPKPNNPTPTRACTDATNDLYAQVFLDGLFVGSIAFGGVAALAGRGAVAEAQALYRLGGAGLEETAGAVQRAWMWQSAAKGAIQVAGTVAGTDQIMGYRKVSSFDWTQLLKNLPIAASYYAYQRMKEACGN
jgi:RHS repeat-associated protein